MSSRVCGLGRKGSRPWHHSLMHLIWIWSESDGWISQVSAERWGAAAEDEVVVCVHSWCFSTAHGY